MSTGSKTERRETLDKLCQDWGARLAPPVRSEGWVMQRKGRKLFLTRVEELGKLPEPEGQGDGGA